jgi:prevent-host-death family protein
MEVESARSTDVWSMTEARLRFGDLLKQSQLRPQTITRRGEVVAVITSSTPPSVPRKREGTLADFLLSCPHRWEDDRDFRDP